MKVIGYCRLLAAVGVALTLAACGTTHTEVVKGTAEVPATATAPAVPATPDTTIVVSNKDSLLDKIIAKVKAKGARLILDLQVSSADAHIQNDKRAYACYDGAIPIVQGLLDDLAGKTPGGGMPDGAGPVYLFQKARDLKGDLAGGQGKLKSIQEDLDVACGGLGRDTALGVFDPAGIFTGP